MRSSISVCVPHFTDQFPEYRGILLDSGMWAKVDFGMENNVTSVQCALSFRIQRYLGGV